MNQEVIYGILDDDLIFIPRDTAEQLAAIHRTLTTATTWGEFLALLPTQARIEIEELYAEDEEPLPEDTRPFVANDVPGVLEGDWPGWPAQMMLAWVPKDIQQTYGKVDFSFVSGNCLTLDATRVDAIVAALTEQGYRCTRDDKLTAEASGR